MINTHTNLKRKLDFLDEHVFYGLANLNDGFNKNNIKHFSVADFEIILSRVRKLGLGITGIEPWRNGKFFAVDIYEDFTDDPADANWYCASFNRFKASGLRLQYSASYYIP